MSVLDEIAAEETQLEMTPMIDVTFLLLIFFLLTLKFKTLEGKLAAYLPHDVGEQAADAQPIEKIEIDIVLRSAGERRDPLDSSLAWSGEGRYEYVGREVDYRVGPLACRSLEALRSRLVRLRDARPVEADPWPVTIRAGEHVSYGDVVPVLDTVIAAGLNDITFVAAGR